MHWALLAGAHSWGLVVSRWKINLQTAVDMDLVMAASVGSLAAGCSSEDVFRAAGASSGRVLLFSFH